MAHILPMWFSNLPNCTRHCQQGLQWETGAQLRRGKKTERSIHRPRLPTDIDCRRPILHLLAITYSCQLCGEAQSPTRVVENPFPLPSCWCFLAPVQNHWGEILLILMACSPSTYCLDLSQQKKSKSMDSKPNSFLCTRDLELGTQELWQPTE